MVAGAVLAIEHVDVVQPHIAVVGIKGYAVIHAAHDREVTELHALGVAHQEAETVDGGIVAYALEGDVQLAVRVLPLHLYALFAASKAIHVGSLDSADEANGERRGDVALLIGIDNGLQSRELARREACLDGLGIGRGDVDDDGIRLQGSVVVIGSHAFVIVEMGKARAVVGPDHHLTGKGSATSGRNIAHKDGLYLHGIASRPEPHDIGPQIGAVVAYQLRVNLCPLFIFLTFYKYMIANGTRGLMPLHIGRFLPAACLENLCATIIYHRVLTTFLLLDEGHLGHQGIIDILYCLLLCHSNPVAHIFYAFQLIYVIKLYVARLQGELHLMSVLCANGHGGQECHHADK